MSINFIECKQWTTEKNKQINMHFDVSMSLSHMYVDIYHSKNCLNNDCTAQLCSVLLNVVQYITIYVCIALYSQDVIVQFCISMCGYYFVYM